MPKGINITAKIIGRDELMKRLDKVAPNAGAALGKTALRHANRLARIIARRAPVRTGRYRRSINAALVSSKPPREQSRSAFARTKDPNAAGVFASFIWRWLEFGTVKMAAQPHVLPSYRAERPTIRRAMRTALRKALRDAMAGKEAA